MLTGNYQSMFSGEMEAIVYILVRTLIDLLIKSQARLLNMFNSLDFLMVEPVLPWDLVKHSLIQWSNLTLDYLVQQLGFPNGGDFGLASATLGLVFSVICGVMLVNIATHRGWVKKERIDTSQEVKISIRLVQLLF